MKLSENFSLQEMTFSPSAIRKGIALNALIGGSRTSQHCFGQAADLQVEGRNHEMFNFIKDNLEFDQVIWEFGTDAEPAWVHVSYNAKHNRKQVLKAVKVNGKTQYLKV
jgi:zinc D-Ala-D-Ala carboxypeptidase